MDAKAVFKYLESNDFVMVRRNGSYYIFYHQDGRKAVVPYHDNKDIHPKTLRSIEKATGLSFLG